ncbi:MAG: GTPase ObgE, partial [Chloroflexi bacterium]|nr:GTPase ObgE [Chloroflexota bacterium]
MFEKVEIGVEAGNGGSGSISFRREKFVPFGGPDGGDGGKGGDVFLQADRSVTALGEYISRRLYRAGKGKNGSGGRKRGKNGEDLVLKVPVGTVVADVAQGAVIADLAKDGERVIVARGGKGGWGNAHYASASNQAPRIAQKGENGEEKRLLLELRIIADVGIIGYPNVGKSTLLASATAARPKIADYPFTTTEPVLGVVKSGERSFVMAEIPGLIEGAHTGRGLGHEFLRHALRTKIIVHLINGASENPVEDMIKVNNELEMYDSGLTRKPQIVAVNKVDLD